MTTLTEIAARIPEDRGPGLLEMFDSGEGGLGLEMIIENLYEFDLAITQAERLLLEASAVDLGLSVQFRQMLAEVPNR